MSLHFHSLRVSDVQKDTDEAVIVRFDVPPELRDAFAYTQGQYLTLRADVDGEDLRRSYSICAGVDDAQLRVGVRRVQGGRFSNWINAQLQPGDVIQVLPPQGRFYVPIDPLQKRHYLGIAGGSGITPILSIMKTVLARETGSRFTLLYGNRKQASTMFKEELEDLKNRYLTRLTLHHVFSDEHVDAPLLAGIMNRDKIAEFLRTLVPPASIDHAFICGPFQMNDEADAALRAAGVPEARIHIERFGTPDALGSMPTVRAAQPGDVPQARLTVIRDGLSREVAFTAQDPSLLDAAARSGMDVPFSCKNGVCATCRCKLIEGEVRMEKNFALDKAEVAAGFILSCQARPLSERVVISFDER